MASLTPGSGSGSSRPAQPPPPHRMCTPAESADRQKHMELSEFESTQDTFALGPRDRMANPNLVVKKYRRSAAGGGVSTSSAAARGAARSIKDLTVTVDHLLGCVLPSQSVYSHDVMSRRKLSTTVSFIDDRIRAVQVDLTTSLLQPSRTAECWASIRTIQAKLARYGILISHLLSDLPSSKYEAKFGKTALRTAIDSYFAAWDATYNGTTLMPTEEEISIRDEMLSYEALMLVSEALRKGEAALPTYDAACGGSEGSGCGAVLASYLRRGGAYAMSDGNDSSRDDDVPDLVDEDAFADGKKKKWSTALEVAAAADQGNLIRIFRLLELKGIGSYEDDINEWRWGVLTRCCIVPAVNVVRIGLLRRYNKSFGKSEKISGTDLARLLYLPSPKAAINFCSDVGLPTEWDGAIMKAAPISITDKDVVKRMTNPGRMTDAYVFGGAMIDEWYPGNPNSQLKASNSSSLAAAAAKPSSLAAAAAAAAAPAKTTFIAAASKKASLSAAAKSWGDDSDEDEDEWENAADNLKFNGSRKDDEDPSFHVDEDGVLVPPGKIIWDIVS